jgi:hypothetical protein
MHSSNNGFGSFSKAPLRRYAKIAEWSLAGLVFGSLFQASMVITGTTPEKVGIFFPNGTGNGQWAVGTVPSIACWSLVGKKKLIYGPRIAVLPQLKSERWSSRNSPLIPDTFHPGRKQTYPGGNPMMHLFNSLGELT